MYRPDPTGTADFCRLCSGIARRALGIEKRVDNGSAERFFSSQRLFLQIGWKDKTMQEIERKFLVTDSSYRTQAESSSRIRQGYICSARGRTVRVRIRDEKGYLTIKGPSDEAGLSRYEWERELPLNEAEELFRLCEPGMIDKVRYLVPCGNHVFEVDEFHGENEGLVVAEVELQDVSEPFETPSFLGEEVTGQVKYYNSFLMKEPYSRWK